ncbi:MAG: hypothetical protein R3F59_10350 [Myxococcota bacterium]
MPRGLAHAHTRHLAAGLALATLAACSGKNNQVDYTEDTRIDQASEQRDPDSFARRCA